MSVGDIQEYFDHLRQETENRSLATTIVESGMLTIIMLVALLGNVLVCRAVYQSPRLRTITNYSVVVLALTDISMAVFVMPFMLSVFILGEQPFSQTACQFQGYAAISLVQSSIFTVTFMSVNRYFKIVKGDHLYRKIFTRKKSVVIFVVMMVVAWIGPMNTYLQGQEFHLHPGKMICMYSYHRQKPEISSSTGVIYYFLPYCITIYCYCRIYIKVRSHNRRIANTVPSTTTTTAINRKDINITKTLFAIFLVFTFCMMQLLVVDYTEVFYGEYKLPRQVYVLYTVMCTMASAVNPFIYGLFSPAFRSEYKRSLCLSSGAEAGSTTDGNKQSEYKVKIDTVLDVINIQSININLNVAEMCNE